MLMKKLVKISLFLLAFIIVLLVIVKSWLDNYEQSKLALFENKIFTLPAGSGRIALKSLLEKEGIITNTRPLLFLFKIKPELSQLKAGTYLLTPNMTIKDMLTVFNQGKEFQFDIRFIEGSQFKEWLPIMAKAAYLEQTLKGKTEKEIAELVGITGADSIEGWLSPDTYSYTAHSTDLMLLQRAYKRMKVAVEEVWRERDANLPYKTSYEMLIMASIIEKETSLSEERPLVASVFINRLRKGMRLQTDPTVIYGMGENYKNQLTLKDLRTSTPYNTYTINGLPPTPIAMPSKASLIAAAHPAQTDYIYFVATGNGGHKFTTQLRDHNKAVQEYREVKRNQKANLDKK